MISTLREDNLVNIPAEIADQLGLEEGSRLKWSHGEAAGTILIEVLPSTRQVLNRVQVLGASIVNRNLVQELIDERVAEDQLENDSQARA